MQHSKTRQLTLAALFLALGLIMPFLTAQIPTVGSRLLPMHIPVLLGGFVLGGPYGAIIGFITPLLRSALFGMPPMFPTATCMAFELATYGFVTGYLYQQLKKNIVNIYITLIFSMIIGRIVWGLVSLLIYSLQGNTFTMTMFVAGGLTNAIPGMILQIILIPILVLALQKAHLLYEK